MSIERQYRTALAWQVGLAAYMQLVSWIPLGKWNFQPCCPTGLEQLRRGTLTAADVISIGSFLLPAGIFWIGARRQWRWAMWLALGGTAIWPWLQLSTWWPPYLFGASARWSAIYARAFSHSTQILPQCENHLPPDALHVVLQALLTASVVTGIWALRRQTP